MRTLRLAWRIDRPSASALGESADWVAVEARASLGAPSRQGARVRRSPTPIPRTAWWIGLSKRRAAVGDEPSRAFFVPRFGQRPTGASLDALLLLPSPRAARRCEARSAGEGHAVGRGGHRRILHGSPARYGVTLFWSEPTLAACLARPRSTRHPYVHPPPHPSLVPRSRHRPGSPRAARPDAGDRQGAHSRDVHRPRARGGAAPGRRGGANRSRPPAALHRLDQERASGGGRGAGPA